MTLVVLVVAALTGCRMIGEMLEGLNSDREHGGGYAKVPQKDAEGQLYVPPTDWAAGPERVY
jgi:hypothetical protein